MHIKLRHQARMDGLIHLMFNENMHPVLEGEDALIGKLKKGPSGRKAKVFASKVTVTCRA